MPDSYILRFAEDADASSVLSTEQYNTDGDRTIGHQPGVARSPLENKVLRQLSAVAAPFAQYIANRQTQDYTDDQTTDELETLIRNAIDGQIRARFNALFPEAFDERFSDQFNDAFDERFNERFPNAFSTRFREAFGQSIRQHDRAVYPIGTLYSNANDNSNPRTFLGFGTWKLYSRGRVLVGQSSIDTDFRNAGQVGGEKTHRLTVNEMPSHNHVYIPGVGGGGPNDASYSQDRTTTERTENTGGDQPHNNVQPYVVVYIWRRTA